MKHSKIVTALSVVCLFLTLTLAGCGGGNSALNPKFQPQVSNQPDNFQFQTTGVSKVTQTLRYTWKNSGASASINQACAITAGTAVIKLRDSTNALMYSGDLKANGTFASNAGVTGDWSIEIVLTNVSGTLNFRVQKL